MLGLSVRVRSNIEQNGVLGFFKEIRNLCRSFGKTENGSSEVT